MRFKLVTFSCFLAMSTTYAFANATQTNLDGVVVKNVTCKRDIYGQHFLEFNVSNRTSSQVIGNIYATLFDQDSDPIDNGNTSVNVGPVSGDKLSIKTDCSKASKYTFRIQ